MEQNCCLLADSCMSLHTRGDSCDRRHAQSGEQPPHQDAPGALSSSDTPCTLLASPAPSWSFWISFPGFSGEVYKWYVVHIHSLLNCQIMFHCMGIAVCLSTHQLKDPGLFPLADDYE